LSSPFPVSRPSSRLQANEAATIDDLRALRAAEESYSSSNIGYYDTAECPATPRRCLQESPGASLAPLLDGPVIGDKNGFRRKFYAGPKIPKPEQGASRSSMTGFAVTAVPIRPGETGQRAFCADASAIICFTADGSEPLVARGQCPIAQKKCQPIH